MHIHVPFETRQTPIRPEIPCTWPGRRWLDLREPKQQVELTCHPKRPTAEQKPNLRGPFPGLGRQMLGFRGYTLGLKEPKPGSRGHILWPRWCFLWCFFFRLGSSSPHQHRSAQAAFPPRYWGPLIDYDGECCVGGLWIRFSNDTL